MFTTTTTLMISVLYLAQHHIQGISLIYRCSINTLRRLYSQQYAFVPKKFENRQGTTQSLPLRKQSKDVHPHMRMVAELAQLALKIVKTTATVAKWRQQGDEKLTTTWPDIWHGLFLNIGTRCQNQMVLH